jgi:hypothetical protein
VPDDAENDAPAYLRRIDAKLDRAVSEPEAAGPAETNPSQRERKLAAKRFNERLKLFVTALNGIAVALVGAGLLVPAIGHPEALMNQWLGLWFLIPIGFHALAQHLIGFLRSEE